MKKVKIAITASLLIFAIFSLLLMPAMVAIFMPPASTRT